MKWKKRFDYLFHRRVKWQMMAIYILVTLIPITLIGVFAVNTLRNQMKASYKTQIEAETTRVKALIFDVTSSAYSFTEPIVSVQEYRNLFVADSVSSEERASLSALTRTLTSLIQSTAAISSIGIYTTNEVIPEGAFIHYVGDDFAGYEWYEKLNPEDWNRWIWTTTQVNMHQTDEELTLVRRIPTGSEVCQAYLVVSISSNHLRNKILSTDSFIMASLSDFNCFFSSDYSAEEYEMPLTDQIEETHYNYLGSYEWDGEKALTKTSMFRAYMTNDKFYVLVSDLDAYDEMNELLMLLCMVFIFAFIGLSWIILLFTGSFSKRVETLRKSMYQASQGDYDIVDEFHGSDELAETFQDLKNMVSMVREKEAQYYRARLEEQRLINMQREMEFKMLASQINPHFLYNTLELIRMQAISQQNRGVANSIMLLARSMHYVLENTGTRDATLEKEFDHVKIYLQIQKMRFGDRVNWNFYLDDNIDIKQYSILPLLIQPVVENAIIHGLEGVKEDGHISIIMEKEKEILFITVRDNGDGMSEERLAKVRENINRKQKDDRMSIGLYNINQRMKARYGAEFGLQIKSECGKGTSVTLVLPLQENEV